MGKTERIYVRIDPETKAKATVLFDRLGITVSDAVSHFIDQSIKSNGLPFHVDDPRINSGIKSSQIK